MKFHAVDSIRRHEAGVIARHDCGALLMERAGTGAARSIASLLRLLGGRHCLLVAGPGNNGGDAFVAARRLLTWGFACEIRLVATPARLRGDALGAYRSLLEAGGTVRCLSEPEFWRREDPRLILPDRAVVVDALLGTGSHGAPRGVAAEAVRWMHRAAAIARIVALDVPTGMDADSGGVHDPAVRADLTVTMGMPKRGFAQPEAWPWLGRLEIVEIGLTMPDDTASGLELPACEGLSLYELSRLCPVRPYDAHKGDFGRLLILGGSRGFAGAPALAAKAALRAGAGLVSLLLPDCSTGSASEWVPEAMAHPLPAPEGCLTMEALRAWQGKLDQYDAILAGPGMSPGPDTREIVTMLLNRSTGKLLLDADALNVLAGWGGGRSTMSRMPPGGCILTPHPGEAARLLDTTVSAVQSDRPGALRRLVEATGAVVVLKGAATLVGAPGRTPSINLSGNSGMATAGAGDVLAGIIAALWGQKLDAWDAARLGVHLHASAGDAAAWRKGRHTLIARDLIDELGTAFSQLTAVSGFDSAESCVGEST